MLGVACRQATLAEQVDGLTVRHSRRSAGLQRVLERVAMVLAGRPNTRLSQALTAEVSGSTPLRLIRHLAEPETSTPRVLGVDDLALRQGLNYRTIQIDIETRQPIDLLPDRATSTVDSGSPSIPASGVLQRPFHGLRRGRTARLLNAIHVADRWHIWSDLAEAVEKTVVQHRTLLRQPHDPSATSRRGHGNHEPRTVPSHRAADNRPALRPRL